MSVCICWDVFCGYDYLWLFIYYCWVFFEIFCWLDIFILLINYSCKWLCLKWGKLLNNKSKVKVQEYFDNKGSILFHPIFILNAGTDPPPSPCQVGSRNFFSGIANFWWKFLLISKILNSSGKACYLAKNRAIPLYSPASNFDYLYILVNLFYKNQWN